MQFTQPDTVIQDFNNPQALNRYSYVLGNPLRYNDPTGHCWGPASFIRGISLVNTTCNNIEQASAIIMNGNASIGDRLIAATYITVLSEAIAVVIIGSAVIGCSILGPECIAPLEALGGGERVSDPIIEGAPDSVPIDPGVTTGDQLAENDSFTSGMEPEEADRYNNYWDDLPRAPEQSEPYDVYNRYNPDGSLHQTTTYDEYGNRAYQYDWQSRQGEHYHEFNYDQTYRRPYGPRADHLFW